jgi:hypothetical protein
MRKLLVIAAAAAVAATIAFPAAAGGGIVAPHRIDDMFRGTSIDYSKVWAWWGTNQPGLVSFSQDNALNVDVSAAAQPDFNVSGETRCQAHGDFSAQVDFDLTTWPPQNGVWGRTGSG